MELSAWDLAAVGVKALLYAATLCAAGGVFFERYTASLLCIVHQRRVRRWVGLCVGIAVLTSAVRPLIVAGSMDESVSGMLDGSMIGMVLQGGEGRATGIRIVALALVGVGVWGSQCTLSSAMALAGALAAATSFAWIGHAWAARNGGLSVALLSVHLVGVAFWVGALMPLLLVGRRGELEALAGTARRFGAIAVYVVVSLLFAGGLLLCTLLPHLTDLWTTDYGRLVCVKLLAVAALLSAAAWNKLRLTPRLQHHDRSAFVGLIRSIKVEVLLAALILGITATMTTLVGPRT